MREISSEVGRFRVADRQNEVSIAYLNYLKLFIDVTSVSKPSRMLTPCRVLSCDK